MANRLICTGSSARMEILHAASAPDEIKDLPCRVKLPNTLILEYRDASDLSGKGRRAASHPRRLTPIEQQQIRH